MSKKTANKSILIKNIYYMLSYAFHMLKHVTYDEIASEQFENIHDLFASILVKGISKQIKQGLYREYIPAHDHLSVLRGKLNINETIQNRIQRRQMLSCEYDEFSENNVFNQILKTTVTLLFRQPHVKIERKVALKKLLLYFGNVDLIEPTHIKWNLLRFDRNNQSYKILLNICYFILNQMLLTSELGKYKMASFLDGHNLSKLFEKFVLEYYRYHHPQLRAAASHVAWNIDDGANDHIHLLPTMKTDITLRYGDQTLIIDTKFYSRSMQVHSQYDSQSFHSSNLYQIFTYVKNHDVNHSGKVAGMLLYAKTEDSIAPDADFSMGGNRISVRTIDLNTEFTYIAMQLDRIANSFSNIAANV